MFAAVMCGGKSTRLKIHYNIEKPLLKINQITMIERIIQTLLNTREFSKIFLITSSNTPKTRSFLLNRFVNYQNIHILTESGIEYSSDLFGFLKHISHYSDERIFILPSDIPFIKQETIKKIIYSKFDDAVFTTVLIDKSFVEKIGIKPSIIKILNDTKYCYSGISLYNPIFVDKQIFEGNKNNSILLKENYLVINEVDLSINVNTTSDFAIAKKLIQ
ncbi:MAG: hypothetical protein DA328_04870 [Nitrososphaeraceae archaeon]|nr:hypothetical protein [Nitrososphaeraceae archaeon]